MIAGIARNRRHRKPSWAEPDYAASCLPQEQNDHRRHDANREPGKILEAEVLRCAQDFGSGLRRPLHASSLELRDRKQISLLERPGNGLADGSFAVLLPSFELRQNDSISAEDVITRIAVDTEGVVQGEVAVVDLRPGHAVFANEVFPFLSGVA